MMSEIFNVGMSNNSTEIVINDDNFSDVSNISKISVLHEEIIIDYNKLIINLFDVSKIESKSNKPKRRSHKEAI